MEGREILESYKQILGLLRDYQSLNQEWRKNRKKKCIYEIFQRVFLLQDIAFMKHPLSS